MANHTDAVLLALGKLIRHDLRSSLSPIVGGVDLLQAGELNPAQRTFVDMILQGGGPCFGLPTTGSGFAGLVYARAPAGGSHCACSSC